MAGRHGLAGAILAVLLVPGGAEPARGEHPVYRDEAVAVDAALTLGTAAIATLDTDFGAGLATPGGRSITDLRWFEGYAMAKVTARVTTDRGRLYGGVSTIGAMTRGDSDASGGTFGRPEQADLEHLYLGWSSGALWPGLGQDAIDVSVGAQDFEIGDGFLVSDGRADFGADAALYLGPRNTFRNSVILRLDTRPVRGDLFYLDTREDYGGVQVLGANLEWVDDARGTLGAYILQGLDTDQAGFATRDGLTTWGLRGQGTPFAGGSGHGAWAPLFLSFEVSRQTNRGSARGVDALAWYGEAGYRLAMLPWQPYVAYRFSHFSGDDPATADSEDFDPLFVGAPRGWGTWFQGEITGQYLFTNSNLNVHMLQLGLAPAETIALHAFWFDFRFDAPAALATLGARDRAFAQELNLIADWAPAAFAEISTVYALALADDGARQIFGDDDAYHLFLLTATVSF